MELKVIHIIPMTLLISGCMHAIDSILVSIFNIKDLKKSKFGYLTLTVNLDFQGQPNFFKVYIIFKVNHHSYIIYFRFFLSSLTSILLKSILKSSL